MKLDKQEHGPVAVISLTGRLDSTTARDVQGQLAALLVPGEHVVLNLRGVTYMSSAGLRVLLLVHRQAEREGIGVALADLPDEVRAIMSATGFLDFFAVADDLDAAAGVLSA